MIIAAFLRKYLIHILGIVSILTLLYGAYDWAYTRGEASANAACQARFDAQQKFRDNQIKTIEDYAKANLQLTAASTEEIMKQVRANKPKGPLTSVPCTPTSNFIDAYNSTIDAVNKK